jgi:hypothetical protein
MLRRYMTFVYIVLCFGLIATGCPKKTLLKGEPSLLPIPMIPDTCSD